MAAADTLQVTLDDYCPYYCKDDSSGEARLAEQPGFVVEILQYAFGSGPDAIEYRFHPWERGLLDVSQGKLDALIMAARSEAPELIYPQQEQARSEGCYYTRRDSTWRYQGIDSLRQPRLTLINGFAYSEPLNSYLTATGRAGNVSYVYGGKPLLRILQMIEIGRTDVTMDDATVVDHLLLVAGLQDSIKKAGCSPNRIDFYVGFSPKNPLSAARAERLSNAMTELRRTGQLQQILARYGVTDWK